MCGRFLIDFENVFNENVYVCIEYVYNNNNIEEKSNPVRNLLLWHSQFTRTTKQ